MSCNELLTQLFNKIQMKSKMVHLRAIHKDECVEVRI